MNECVYTSIYQKRKLQWLPANEQLPVFTTNLSLTNCSLFIKWEEKKYEDRKWKGAEKWGGDERVKETTLLLM